MNSTEKIHSRIVGRTVPGTEHFPFESAEQVNDMIAHICENGSVMLNEITFLERVR